jgi:TRAP-type C4-dicarboxylate transport system permease small subunit
MSVVAAGRPLSVRPLFVRAADSLALGLAWMACAATVGIVLLLAMEMVARWAFNHSFSFAWEYASYALGILIFGGLGWTLRTGGHIRVTVLENALPSKVYRMVEWVAILVGAVLATLLAAAMVWICKSSFVDQSRSFLATETLLYVPQVFVALGAVGFALQLWLRLYLFQTGQPVEIRAARIESAQSHV